MVVGIVQFGLTGPVLGAADSPVCRTWCRRLQRWYPNEFLKTSGILQSALATVSFWHYALYTRSDAVLSLQ